MFFGRSFIIFHLYSCIFPATVVELSGCVMKLLEAASHIIGTAYQWRKLHLTVPETALTSGHFLLEYIEKQFLTVCTRNSGLYWTVNCEHM